MKKLSILVGFFLALVSCGGNTTATSGTEYKEETYVLVSFLRGSEFFNWTYAGFRDAAASVGPHIKTEYRGPVDWDATAEARAVDQAVAQKVQGIAVTAGDAATLEPAINKAIERGVPVVTFDSDSDKSKRLVFVGTDHFNAGFSAGVHMGKLVGNSARVGISLIPGLASIDGRVKGFTEGLLSVAPQAKIVTSVNDEGDLQKAEQVITAMLQANPEINIIFAAHGNPTVGAFNSTKNVGRDTGANKIHVMGFDIDLPVLELVQNGSIVGSVGQNPYLMGVMSFHALYSAAHKSETFSHSVYTNFGPVPSENIDTGVIILQKDDANIKAFLNSPKI